MKFYFIILLWVLSINSGWGQVPPPDLKFINLEPEWLYISKDTTFIKSDIDIWSTPYWGRRVVSFIQDDQDMYILEEMLGQSPRSGIEGGLVHKVDLKTGKKKWIYHSTSYVGLKHREYYGAGSMRLLSDGNIGIYGLRQYDTIHPTLPQFYYEGSPLVKYIDSEDGTLLEEDWGKDTIREEVFNYVGLGNHFITSPLVMNEGLYFGGKSYVDPVDTLLKSSIDFYKLDDNFDFVLPPVYSMVHNTGIHNGLLSFVERPQVYNLTDDTVLVLTGIRHPEDDFYLSELNLTWIDKGDVNDIHAIKQLDVLPDIYQPEELINHIKIQPKDNQFVLSQLVWKDTTGVVDSDHFIYLHWYDQDGNKVASIDALHKEDTYTYYWVVNNLGIRDGALYLAAYFETESEEGIDIIKVSPGNNQYEKMVSIIIPRDDLLSFNYRNSTFLPDGDLLLSLGVFKTVDDIRRDFEYYYRFDAKDLNLPVVATDIVNKRMDFELYPNPASDKIIITMEQNRDAIIQIYNMNGQLVLTDRIIKKNTKTMDIKSLAAGIYTVKILDPSGNLIMNPKTFFH